MVNKITGKYSSSLSYREIIAWLMMFAGVLVSSGQLIEPGIAPKFLIGYLGLIILPKDKLIFKWSSLNIVLSLFGIGLIGSVFIHWLIDDVHNLILELSRLFSLLFLPIFMMLIVNPLQVIQLKLVYSILNVVLLLSLGYAVIYAFIGLDGLNEGSSYGLNSFFDHRNVLGGFSVLGLILITYFYFKSDLEKSPRNKLFTGINWVLGTFIILNLFSLSAWISFALLLMAVLIVLVIKRSKYEWIILVASLVIGSGYFFASANVQVEDVEFSKTSSSMGQSGADRIEFWKKTVEICAENPIIGVGSGKWMLYAGENGWKDTQASDGLTFVNRPHNDWLWISSEFGLFAGLCYLLVTVIIIGNLVRSIIGQFKPEKIVLLVGLGVLVVYSTVSFPSERYSLLLLMMLIYVLSIDKTSNKEGREFKLLKSFLNGLTIFGVAVFIFVAYSDKLSLKVVSAKHSESLQGVYEEISSLVKLGYTYDRLGIPMDWYLGTIALRQNNYELAKSQFEKSLRIAPYLALNYNDLAVSKMMLKEEGVESDLRRSIEMCPDFQEAHLNLSTYYYLNNQCVDAVDELNHVVDKNYLYRKQEILKLCQ